VIAPVVAPAGARPTAEAAAPPSAPSSAHSAGPAARPTANDPALEKRLLAVTKELRCMVCQNETIAESHATLAVDMRNEVREQLRSGMTDRQVIDFMVARYGNFVRFRPPLDATTLALWFGPGLLLLGGLTVLVRQLARRKQAVAGSDPALSDHESEALTRLSGKSGAAPGGTGPG